MNKIIQRTTKWHLIFFGLLLFHLMAIFGLKQIFPVIHFSNQNLLIGELLNWPIFYPAKVIFILEIFNVILIWLIARQVFKEKLAIIPVFIWVISPWVIYETVAKSFYLYLVFLLEIGTLGFLISRPNFKKLGLIVMVISIVIACYSSIFMLLLLSIFFGLIFGLRLLDWKKSKNVVTLVGCLILPLLFLFITNFNGVRNIISDEVTIFTDPGFINSINRLQGQSSNEGWGKFARISENKYVFGAELIAAKSIAQLMPLAFFTFQEKLLTFSFSPPIFLGFLTPLVYGLVFVLSKPKWRKLLTTALVLIFPSVLAKPTVDLNRLIIFFPVLVFIISLGFSQLVNNRQRSAKVILWLTFFLILIQLLITISDIALRERIRYFLYKAPITFNLGKQ